MLRKILIRKAIPKTKPPARQVHHIQIKGATTEEGGAAGEAEVAEGAEAIRRKENGIASSTRRTMITVQTTTQTRKDLKLSSRRKRRRRRGPVPLTKEILSLTLSSHLNSNRPSQPIEGSDGD
jgi:hypothetical protein